MAPVVQVPRMTTLADIRTRVRQDLHDTEATAYRWSDSQIDRHIEHALADVSLFAPRELSANIATTAGSREVSLATLAGLIAVQRVEFPAGSYPPCPVRFRRWGDRLALAIEEDPGGEEAGIFYTAGHVLDDSGSTVPVEIESTMVMGAAAFAVLERSAFATEQLNTGGESVPAQLAAWARAREVAFRQLLMAHGRRRIRTLVAGRRD